MTSIAKYADTAASASGGSPSLASALSPTITEVVPISTVQMSLPALLKIMQHSRDCSAPQAASGQLLGMDAGNGVMEVSDVFPHAASLEDDMEQEEYQMDMLKTIREVNVDSNTVGWYQVCSTDGFVSSSFIDTQVSFQSSIENSIVLIYDHFNSLTGSPAIMALRLKEDFIRCYRDRRCRAFSEFAGMSMFEQYPISIKLSILDRLLLTQLVNDDQLPHIPPAQAADVNLLKMKTVVGDFSRSIDDVLTESGRVSYALRATLKQQQAMAAQLQRLNADNAQRAQSGQELLPVATVLNNFRTPADPARVPYFLASANLHSMIDNAADPKTN